MARTLLWPENGAHFLKAPALGKSMRRSRARARFSVNLRPRPRTAAILGSAQRLHPQGDLYLSRGRSRFLWKSSPRSRNTTLGASCALRRSQKGLWQLRGADFRRNVCGARARSEIPHRRAWLFKIVLSLEARAHVPRIRRQTAARRTSVNVCASAVRRK